MRQLPNMLRSEYGPPSEDQIERVLQAIEREWGQTKEALRNPDAGRRKSRFSSLEPLNTQH
jgi:hypothetical protein